MNKLYIFAPEVIGKINPDIYGQFAEHIGGVIYDGIWVGKESDVPNIHGFRKYIVDMLKRINVPVLRWPGGCFAETYDWRDGIGDPQSRPVRRNWWIKWDGQYENNQVGTHEFMEFCNLIGARPYFAANLNSCDILNTRNWLDYCNSPKGTTTMAKLREENGQAEPFGVKTWGIGNENWGGGGNMSPEAYAEMFRRLAVVFENTDSDLDLIACGPDSYDFAWTHGFMKNIATSYKHISGFSLHHYCYSTAEALAFSMDDWYNLIADAADMDRLIQKHWNIISAYNMEDKAKLVVDEWGAWNREAPVSGPSGGEHLFEQEVTMRDAMVSAVTLNILNNNCDKVRMANAAQLVNCIQSLFLSKGKDCVATANYHVFDMYQSHMNGTAVRTVCDCGDNEFAGKDGLTRKLQKIFSSASMKDGILTITVCNTSAKQEETFQLDLIGIGCGEITRFVLLQGDNLYAHNTFENPQSVLPEEMPIPNDNVFTLPAGSIALIQLNIK
ncbi:MAG: alpha-N-arabinofuranosidase [Tyzzerella sp.]|nr:alpha-N-arabinofuranosidase [Tyzzerella sp.]